MFERPAHLRVAALLDALEPDVLRDCALVFGGGTRIALELHEFRESRDVDFLTTDAGGFASLRIRVKEHGCAALFTDYGREHFSFPREAKVDAYAVRFPVVVGGVSVRAEFIREARILLEPGATVPWTRVPCLTISDCFAEKLLANSDRWPDDSVLARDLIDLAALRGRFGPIPLDAWHRAEGAYKEAARLDLRKASARFAGSEAHRTRCFDGLAIALEQRPLMLDCILRWAEGLD